jgi:hypothetical protein
VKRRRERVRQGGERKRGRKSFSKQKFGFALSILLRLCSTIKKAIETKIERAESPNQH